MTTIETTPRVTVPGFWTRLALAIQEASESYEERLDKRVAWLEAEVKPKSLRTQKV